MEGGSGHGGGDASLNTHGGCAWRVMAGGHRTGVLVLRLKGHGAHGAVPGGAASHPSQRSKHPHGHPWSEASGALGHAH